MGDDRSKRKPYIVGPAYDWIFFLSPPLLALALGFLVATYHLGAWDLELAGEQFTAAGLALGVFIHAHLVIVFFRSHGNRTILEQFPVRFLVVPAALFVAMIWSPWVAVCASVLATFWDVYHSGAQTFGFARIYDSKAKNAPDDGRTLDIILNQLLYAGPIVAGAVMMDHFEDFYEFEVVEAAFFTEIPVWMEGNQGYFTRGILGAGALFLVYYVWFYVRRSREGYVVPWPKVFLLVSTGFVSIFTWGFNTWGEAFLIMNVFHALQYFGIVWAMEHDNITGLFRLQKIAWGKRIAWVLFVTVAVCYGLAVEAFAGSVHTWWAATIVVSLMHFWYDGFIWSVRKPSTPAKS